MRPAPAAKDLARRRGAVLVSCRVPPHVEKVRDALRRAALPPPAPDGVRALGEGGVHRAFHVALEDGREVVVRLRKRPRRGPRAEGLARARSEYTAARFFYRFANERVPGLCPELYLPVVDDARAGTVESFLGPSLATLLPALEPQDAAALGARAGRAFARLHEIPSPPPGRAPVPREGEELRGREEREARAEEARGRLREAWEGLRDAPLAFDRWAVGPVAQRLLAAPPPEARWVLTSAEVGPDALTRRDDGSVGLIDPAPVVGDEARYVAFFLYTYRLLIPSLARTRRFARYRLGRHEALLEAVAEGYWRAYRSCRPDLDPARVAAERFRWTLRDAWHQQRRRATAEGAAGEAAEARLARYLRELERLAGEAGAAG